MVDWNNVTTLLLPLPLCLCLSLWKVLRVGKQSGAK